MFEDWDGLHGRVASGVPGGWRIVAAVDAIAGACPPGPRSGQDLVHGNFNLANTIATPGRLWVVDVEALGAGPRAYDLAVRLDPAAIEGLRAMIRAGGVRQLAVGDLRADEAAGLAWSGNPAHLPSAAAALRRAAQGLEDYLVVRAPVGEPVAKMRIDYTSEAGTGVFSQLATMGPLQGLGIATMLIGAGEQRVRARGLAFAALGVKDNNPDVGHAVAG